MHAIYCQAFVHAISGCDVTTSRMFGIKKSTTFQKILNEIRLRESAMMVMNHNGAQDEIVKNKNANINLYTTKQRYMFIKI